MGGSDLPLLIRQRIERRWQAQEKRLRECQRNADLAAVAVAAQNASTPPDEVATFAADAFDEKSLS